MTDMREGVCPKCGSNEVHYNHDKPQSAVLLSHWHWSGTKVLLYVCTNCGYCKNYILQSDALRQIAEEWQRADGRKKKNDES